MAASKMSRSLWFCSVSAVLCLLFVISAISCAEPADSLFESYVGCYKDNINDRILSNHREEITKNTPEKCRDICYRLGYLYAGVEYGFECFCSNSHPPPSLLRSDSQCDTLCPGDSAWKCGGGLRVSIYDTGISDVPSLGKKMGCFQDGDPRVLEGYKIDLEVNNSPRRCLNLCRSIGYKFSGVEYGVECFCGNVIIIGNSTRDVNDKECNTTCPGENGDSCGGNWKLNVHRTGIDDPKPVVKKVGCFSTDPDSSLKHYRQELKQSSSWEKCVQLCYNKGFTFSSLIYNNQCWCDIKRPTSPLTVGNQECLITQVAIYDTGYIVTPPGGKDDFLGCFNDRSGKGLGGESRTEPKLTPETCALYCFNMGYLFSATKNKNECLCGDSKPIESASRDDCSVPCSGDGSKRCGGSGKMSVTSTGITDLPTKGKLIGCFSDETHPRVLTGHKTEFENTNSPRRCLNYCRRLGYKFAGLQYQIECFCGDTRPSAGQSVADAECDSVCSGDASETCGGGWRMQVYRTGLDSDGDVTVSKPATESPRPAADCERSETLVNGRRACRGAVVFKDTFGSRSIAPHWKHVIKIADVPDYEFVTFTSDPANSYQRDGKMFIKPTVIADRDVENGTISLIGCTGLAASRECELTAFSYNILPPIRSARIHTRNSFSFRYGVVEIRARLPAGDWLLPELWLLPKDQSYGTDYLSGKIRVAMSRGNRYLTSRGEDIGSSVLESGVQVGPERRVNERLVKNKISDSWSSSMHNYTLIWTPDNLSFYVDGQSQQALLPPSVRLADMLGFSKEDNPAWFTGSRIAPFDTDFYLSLGVSAGGFQEFPDGSFNRDQPKPWTNFKLKAMLNFWLNKWSWKPTWEDGRSSLIIEHVQVTAL